MQRSRLLNRIALAAIVALMAAAAPCDAFALCKTRFTCSPGASPYCYFAVHQSGGSTRKIRVEAGGAQVIYGLTPGAEYCSAIGGWPDLEACNAKLVKFTCE